MERVCKVVFACEDGLVMRKILIGRYFPYFICCNDHKCRGVFVTL